MFQQSVASDPFAWRQTLEPGISPAGSAHSSRTGSRQGGDSGASTPRSATPPLSPAVPGCGSARSSRSNLSARSAGAGSAREGYPLYQGGANIPADMSARSSHSYATPEPSARSSDFASIGDASSSACATARQDAFGTLYEEAQYDQFGATYVSQAQVGSTRRRHHAAAAALDAFAPMQQAEPATPSVEKPAAEASLDPRTVLSAARHGRHKTIEASLIAGFDPAHQDTFGNTLFHVACQNGNKRIAKLAIKYGGHMDQQNFKGNTGLHFLFAYGYPDIAEYFIEKGANENVLNELGKSAREGIK